jgi:hypothetical protein
MTRSRRVPTVETLMVPHEHMAFADRRIDDIVRRCCRDQNIVESVARSCYLQGVWDGVQLALAQPELLAEMRKE